MADPTDTATRLRERAEELKSGWPVLTHDMLEAAYQLDRLQSENAELRDELRRLLRRFETCARLHGNSDEVIASATATAIALLDGKAT